MTNDDKSPLINPHGQVIAKIGASERDTTLNNAPPATSHRRNERPTPARESSAPDDSLALPRGALVALRKSGGLAFSSQELVVYRTGRVTQRGSGVGRASYERTSQQLDAEQIDELTLLLKQANFPRFPAATRHSPDTLVTEIIARVGRRVKAAELAPGGAPDGLVPLMRWLGALLAQDE